MKRVSAIFSVLQKVGQSLMVPVSVLPAAGLLVAIGRIITSAAGDQTHGFLYGLGQICYSGGLAIFEQLPVVFAVGVAIGFTGGAGVAGLAAVVGYFTLTNVLKVIGDARGLELAINTGVFGGILVGLVTASIYQRFYQTRLHPVFGFFAGKRLVPILTAAAALVLGIGLGFAWPPVQNGIHSFGTAVMGSEFGPGFYAACKRLLIPLGLHHVFYPPFLYEFGSYTMASGKVLHGESARYFAGDPTAGRFMASEFPIMLFGLPAAALAMTLRAESSRRKAVAGVMLTAALTSIITGITEPIEFAFIFVAPILFVFHVLAAFLCGVLTTVFDIHLGYTFSASLIDYGLGFFNQKNSIYLFTIVGPAIALLYFGAFYWGIKLFNLKTPGREDDQSASTAPAVAASERSREILIALGGTANIRQLDACITRLRLTLADSKLVDQARLKALGAAGLLDAGGGNFQVIFGVESDRIKEEIRALMAGKEIIAAAPVQRPVSIKAGGVTLRAPLAGKIVPITEVPDATFADKILGDGVAIDPTEGMVYSPVDGQVVQLFRTGHAIGLATDNGVEILIHIGIDTVKLNGRGFKALVQTGERVHAGQKLIEFDLDLVRREAKSAITPVVITNSADAKGLSVLGKGTARISDDLLAVTLN